MANNVDDNQWELSKENIQPIKQGRRAAVLSTGLNESLHQVLNSERQNFEQQLRCYEGDDPLEIWFQYANWTEQNYPKGGNDGKLIKLLESCFKSLTASGDLNSKYKNDERLLELWIKYANHHSNLLEVFEALKHKGFFQGLSKFYECLALELENSGSTKKASKVFLEGIDQKAEPRKDLQIAFKKFLWRTGQKEENDPEYENVALTSESNESSKRKTLGALSTIGKRGVAPYERVSHTTGSAGTFRSTVPKRNTASQFQIHQDAEDVENRPPIAEGVSFVPHSDTHKENLKSVNRWNDNKMKQHRVPNVPVEDVGLYSRSSFTVYNDGSESSVDGLSKPSEFVKPLSVRKSKKSEFDDWEVPLFIEEPFNSNAKPMYPKHLVYCGVEEFSLEELMALDRTRNGGKAKCAKLDSSIDMRITDPAKTVPARRSYSKDYKDWEVPLFIQEPFNPDARPMYPKQLVYSGTEEFSPEELMFFERRNQENVQNESLKKSFVEHQKSISAIRENIEKDSLSEVSNPSTQNPLLVSSKAESFSSLSRSGVGSTLPSPNSNNSSKWEASMTVNTKFANKLIMDMLSGTLLKPSSSEDHKSHYKSKSHGGAIDPMDAGKDLASNKPVFNVFVDELVSSKDDKNRPCLSTPFTIHQDENAIPFTIHQDENAIPFTIHHDENAIPLNIHQDENATPFTIHQDKIPTPFTVHQDENAIPFTVHQDKIPTPFAVHQDENAIPFTVHQDKNAVSKEDKRAKFKVFQDENEQPFKVINDENKPPTAIYQDVNELKDKNKLQFEVFKDEKTSSTNIFRKENKQPLKTLKETTSKLRVRQEEEEQIEVFKDERAVPSKEPKTDYDLENGENIPPDGVTFPPKSKGTKREPLKDIPVVLPEGLEDEDDAVTIEDECGVTPLPPDEEVEEAKEGIVNFTLSATLAEDDFAKMASLASTPKAMSFGMVPQMAMNEDYTMAIFLKSKIAKETPESEGTKATEESSKSESAEIVSSEKSDELMPPPPFSKLEVCTPSTTRPPVTACETFAPMSKTNNLSTIMEASRENRSTSSSSGSCTTMGSNFKTPGTLTRDSRSVRGSVEASVKRFLPSSSQSKLGFFGNQSESFNPIFTDNTKSGYFADRSRGDSLSCSNVKELNKQKEVVEFCSSEELQRMLNEFCEDETIDVKRETKTGDRGNRSGLPLKSESPSRKKTVLNTQSSPQVCSDIQPKASKVFSEIPDDSNKFLENLPENLNFSGAPKTMEIFESRTKGDLRVSPTLLSEEKLDNFLNLDTPTSKSPPASTAEFPLPPQSDSKTCPQTSTHEDIDPFCPKLQESLLRGLNLPIHGRKGFVGCSGKVPNLKANMRVKLGKEHYDVRRPCGSGAYAKVFYATTVDPMNVTVFLSNDEFDEHDDVDEKSQMVMKIQKPASGWEFYICHELRERLKSRVSDDKCLDWFQRVNRAYFFDQGSILVSQYHKFGTILDLVNTAQKVQKVIPESMILLIVGKVLKILTTLHSCDFIHGDVKPDNVLLCDDLSGWDVLSTECSSVVDSCPNLVQLIDFGRTIDMTLLPPGITFTKKVKTDKFECCEMRDGRPWTFQTDLYGLASIAYVLIFSGYMEVQKSNGVWGLAGVKIHRYLKGNFWNRFFQTLLNAESCSSLPDLRLLSSEIEDILREKGLKTIKKNVDVLSLVLKQM